MISDAQREQVAKAINATAARDIARREELREEGRQEILREIAAIVAHPESRIENGLRNDLTCAFCYATIEWKRADGSEIQEDDPEEACVVFGHKPDCLWLRASRVPQ